MEEGSHRPLPKRSEIAWEFKWRPDHIFADDALWEEEYNAIKGLIAGIGRFRGKLSEGAAELLECLQEQDKIHERLERLFVYAMMRKDEDNTNTRYQAFFDRAHRLAVEVEEASSFIVPEILEIPQEKLWEFVDALPALQVYRHYLEDILRSKPHILSANEERIIAMAGEVTSAPRNVFTMLNDADIRFPTIRDEEGREVELTKGRYIQFMQSQDRRVRREAFEALYHTYARNTNTLASLLNSSVKRDIFMARVRNYPSSLASALHPDNVPMEVYENLIATVRSHLPVMHRYVELRRKALGVDELHMYDLYVPIVKDVRIEIPFEEAKKMVREGLSALGERYLSDLDRGLSGGWIDVYENLGKTSGGYSVGAYGVHPFVLLNYQGTLDDLFTLAHEMGHAMHTFYSNAAQPYIYANYSIFVAEVASTVNEALLLEYLLQHADDKGRRMYLINHYLEEFRGTVYRQTMFAEFEKIIHERAEAGEALTPDLLKSIYRDLNIAYYGPGIVVDEEIDMEWARIPHFYRAFYVYKYATGFSAAIALSQGILREGQPAIDRYLRFLASGSSDYPIELLKAAGVDMTSPDPIKEALGVFDHWLTELARLMGC